MSETVETYFVRHTEELDINDKTRERLWNERKIAIHFPQYKDDRDIRNYPDNSSLDPADYPKQKAKAIRKLLTLAKSGGYVCAQYYPREECLVGYVVPNTQVELLYGTWGQRNGLGNKQAILKCLTLTKAQAFKIADLAVILVGRPIQGTISRWPNAKQSIENIVERRKIEPCLDLLFPYQQEIMCSEFLRSSAMKELGLLQMAHLLLPVGRTMTDLDIYGISQSGARMFAQVTHKRLEQAQGKLKRLKRFATSGDDTLILFCNTDSSEQIDGVEIVPLKTAYDSFTKSPAGSVWLKSAISAISGY